VRCAPYLRFEPSGQHKQRRPRGPSADNRLLKRTFSLFKEEADLFKRRRTLSKRSRTSSKGSLDLFEEEKVLSITQERAKRN